MADVILSTNITDAIQVSDGLTSPELVSSLEGESFKESKIVGYWQNWSGLDYIKLGEVSPRYNIIDVAFALPKSTNDMTIEFNLDTNGTTEVEFKKDVRAIQADERKVLISLGGAICPPIRLNTAADKQKFVSSIINIIEEYGFDGLDIDLEGGSVGLDAGDDDFKNPTTVAMVNLIGAIKDIHDHFVADDFLLTTSPETAFVQGGYGAYGGQWNSGAYLPLLYGLRDEFDLIHVQYYNSGDMYGPDGNVYDPGTPDFLVALSESLLQGFPVNRNQNNIFPAFSEDKVAIGLLTVGSEGSGYMQYDDIKKALDYLTKGISYGGQYILQKPGGYPDFGGIMGWSINYDKVVNNYSFVNNSYNYFFGSVQDIRFLLWISKFDIH
jgi:chitinase